MSDSVITVQHVSKKYALGHAARHDGFRHLIQDLAMAPWRWMRNSTSRATGGAAGTSKNGVEFWALKDVSFDVKRGDLVGIIGRNGAGKSTLLKILSRITEQTEGRVEINGRVASLLEVGTGFHPELTGRENVFLNGSILGMSRAEIRSKFDEIVSFAEVEKFLDTPVKRYSSGMYVRLAFAVAAHLEPEILIVDEVLAVGDMQFQKKCLGKMKDVAGQGRTVLFVSHNVDAIAKLCTRGVLLGSGKVVAAGPIDEIITKYLSTDATLKTEFPITPPKETDAPACATRLGLEDLNGAEANGFAVGKPWQIRVSFTVNRAVEHFIGAVGLVSSRGVSIWTAWTTPRDLQPGRYEALFVNDQVCLCSGSFSIVVGLSSLNKTFHYVEEAGRLVIAEVSEVSEAVKSNGDCGFIVNPMLTSVVEAGEIKRLA